MVRHMAYAIGPLSVCPVRLSVTLVYCGHTIGWIRMPLGSGVSIGPVHIAVKVGTQLPLKGAQQPPTFRPMSIVTKWLDVSKCHLVQW